MKITTGPAALVGLLLAATALAGCSSTSSGSVASDCTPDSKFSTIKDGTLSIIGPDYPPLFTYESQKMSGVDGEFLKGFAKANCLKTTVRVLPAAGVIEAVKGGQGDVAAGGWFPTEERAQIVGQTDPVYQDPMVLVGKDPSSDFDSYKGQRIGTTQGYLWTADLQKFAGKNAKLYASPDAVFQDLVAGRIDVALMATDEAAFRLDKAPEGTDLSYVSVNPTQSIKASLSPSVTNYPHTKANTELGDALNAYAEKIRDDGGLGDILKKFGIKPAFADPSAAATPTS